MRARTAAELISDMFREDAESLFDLAKNIAPDDPRFSAEEHEHIPAAILRAAIDSERSAQWWKTSEGPAP